jgi:DNA-binding NarL/FixJ family response regulator
MVVASGEDDPAAPVASTLRIAAGFLPKAETAEVLVHALRLILSGGTYLPAQALRDLPGAATSPRSDASPLTPRQTDVLRLLMQGRPNKVIARSLGLTEGTVKLHIAAILRALQSRNRTEAVMAARRIGIDV